MVRVPAPPPVTAAAAACPPPPVTVPRATGRCAIPGNQSSLVAGRQRVEVLQYSLSSIGTGSGWAEQVEPRLTAVDLSCDT